MDKQWNSSDRAELEALRDESRKRVANEEKKRWGEIRFPLGLQDALTRLTKNELSAIRSNLRVHKASSLNKGDLAALLGQVIPSLTHGVLQQLDEERYGVLKRIADGGGQAFVPLDPYQYEYFQLRGLAFTGTVNGKRTLVMPQEVLEAFILADGPSLRAMAKRHSEWIQLSQGLLFYYGYLSTGDIVRLVEEYSGGRVDTYKYLTVLFDAFDYGCPIRAYFNGFTNDDVIDIRRVIREHESRPDVAFYPFTKAQLLKAGKPGYVDRNPAYKAFVDFLKRSYDTTSGEAEEEAEFCVYEIQNGDSLGDMIQDITEEFEIPTLDVLQALSHYLSELHNNTRQWFLKGHTPKELLPVDLAALRPLPVSMGGKGEVIDMATKKKIGRNDPCPCGSGQKYKKCCGR